LSLSSRGLCSTVALSQPEACQRQLQRVGHVPAFIVVQSFQAMM
jgi:hypothetical protein